MNSARAESRAVSAAGPAHSHLALVHSDSAPVRLITLFGKIPGGRDAQATVPRMVPLCATHVDGPALLLAPAIVGMAYRWPYGPAFVGCLIGGLLSDVFDGILARRLGVATAGLRRLDSAADVAFYLAVLWSAGVVYPDVLWAYAPGICAVLGLEAVGQVVSLVRAGRPPATHAYQRQVLGALPLRGVHFALGLRMDPRDYGGNDRVRLLGRPGGDCYRAGGAAARGRCPEHLSRLAPAPLAGTGEGDGLTELVSAPLAEQMSSHR